MLFCREREGFFVILHVDKQKNTINGRKYHKTERS